MEDLFLMPANWVIKIKLQQKGCIKAQTHGYQSNANRYIFDEY